jgi:hypothetical protein
VGVSITNPSEGRAAPLLAAGSTTCPLNRCGEGTEQMERLMLTIIKEGELWVWYGGEWLRELPSIN